MSGRTWLPRLDLFFVGGFNRVNRVGSGEAYRVWEPLGRADAGAREDSGMRETGGEVHGMA